MFIEADDTETTQGKAISKEEHKKLRLIHNLARSCEKVEASLYFKVLKYFLAKTLIAMVSNSLQSFSNLIWRNIIKIQSERIYDPTIFSFEFHLKSNISSIV